VSRSLPGKILIISPEVYPQIKVGGLGKMVAGVVKGLNFLGVEVKLVSPQQSIYWPLSQTRTRAAHWRLGLTAQKACKNHRWWPDWLWLHDWGGAWAAAGFYPKRPTKILWTIHSPLTGDYGYADYGQDGEVEPIDWGESFFDFAALLKQNVTLADRVTTVSLSFARFLGQQPFLATAGPVVGVNNGVDKKEWDSRADPLLAYRRQTSWREFKEQNKLFLQTKLGLSRQKVPLFCFVSRLVPQKGLTLLLQVLPEFLGKNLQAQFVFVGEGCKSYQRQVLCLRKQFPRQVWAKTRADFALPHQIFAAADYLVLPSLAEPFGLVVAEARRYGVLPIVHLVDGLKDQVKDGENGFGFSDFRPASLLGKMMNAYRCWRGSWYYRQLTKGEGLEDWTSVSRKWLGLMSQG
jgi:glycogen synthase